MAAKKGTKELSVRMRNTNCPSLHSAESSGVFHFFASTKYSLPSGMPLTFPLMIISGAVSFLLLQEERIITHKTKRKKRIPAKVERRNKHKGYAVSFQNRRKLFVLFTKQHKTQYRQHHCGKGDIDSYVGSG